MVTNNVEGIDLEELRLKDQYRAWQIKEGVRVIEDFLHEDLNAIELSPWPRKGGSGAILVAPNPYLVGDAHVVELEPRGKSEPEHHLYQERVYVLSGRGSTSMWVDEKEKVTFEWQRGSLFAIPMNVWYQHFNGSGTDPARYVAVTTAPPVMRHFQNLDFVFNCPYVFTDRFAGEKGYFSGSGKHVGGRVWETNFVPDATSIHVYENQGRGAGGAAIALPMAAGTYPNHISSFPPGTYKKAHRHAAGTHLILLGGEGYSLFWQEGGMERRMNWKQGSMMVVPFGDCFHQHFNTGTTPARYVTSQSSSNSGAFGYGTGRHLTDVGIEQGGIQLEYEKEDPEVHRTFEAELAEHGAVCRMKGMHPLCTGIDAREKVGTAE